VVAVAVLAVAGGVSASYAADPVIDLPAAGTTGSLTIHKYEADGTNSVIGDGQLENPAPNATPLDGVEFTIRQVNTIDLHTNAGWRAAADLAAAFDGTTGSITGAGYTLGTAVVDVTAGGGIILLDDLPLGVYLVEETDAPAGVTPAAPFLVTIPITGDEAPGSNNTWLYDVHAYPKNTINTATKSVADAGVVQVGDTTTWTVRTSIKGKPVDMDGDGTITGNYEQFNITGYRVWDVLDDRLVYQAAPAYTVSIVNPTTFAQVATLTAGVDYTWVAPSVTPNVIAGAANAWSIQFIDPVGLEKLMDNNGNLVQVTFATQATMSGTIPNTGHFDTSYGDDTESGDIPTNEVDQRYGGLLVLKTDDTGSGANLGAGLAGAVFEVYTALDAAGKPVPASKVTITPAPAGPGVSQWTSASDGSVGIDGLRYSDWANGKQIVDTNADGSITDEVGFVQYYLVEVTSPAGYALQPNAIPFTITAPMSTDLTDPDAHVVNVKKFNLPLTGGAGLALLVTTGGVLIGGGLVLFVVMAARRRKQQRVQPVAQTLL
jgi:hypothetical protein